jgi:hypothetical protein
MNLRQWKRWRRILLSEGSSSESPSPPIGFCKTSFSQDASVEDRVSSVEGVNTCLDKAIRGAIQGG